MIDAWYATRETVKAALDVAETSRSNTQIDVKIAASSRSVDALCHRTFAPWTGTRTFDWPDLAYPTPWRIWLDQHDLVSITGITTGGETIPTSQVILRPDDGPPYTHIELLLTSSYAFGGGDTPQRSVAVTGEWDYATGSAPAGRLAEDIHAAETDVDVTDSAAVGVGDLLLVDTERMQVTGKRLADTGQTLTAGLAASMADQALTVASGTGFAVGEILLVDTERVRVDDIAGDTLIVKRAHDGSTLAAHALGATIYAPRTLVVTRGVAGTDAVAHANSTTITRHVPPALVESLTVAETLAALLQTSSGYAGSSSSGAGEKRPAWGAGLPDLRAQVYAAHGRKHRARAV